MLDETSNMPEYQWKLTIVERNLLLSNWMKLIPEAQAQMLQEADALLGDLPLPNRQRLLTCLERLQDHIEGDLQPKLHKILSSRLSLDIRTVLEMNLKNTTLLANGLGLDSSVLVESIN